MQFYSNILKTQDSEIIQMLSVVPQKILDLAKTSQSSEVRIISIEYVCQIVLSHSTHLFLPMYKNSPLKFQFSDSISVLLEFAEIY
jgi:hypothetical protein